MDYIIIIVIFLFLSLFALGVFCAETNKSIPSEEEEQAQDLLQISPLRIQKACKYQCPQCGNSLLPDLDGLDVRCYKCNNLWHPDYILTVYEDKSSE